MERFYFREVWEYNVGGIEIIYSIMYYIELFFVYLELYFYI